MNRVAIIDLGTNTFNLLIIERQSNGTYKNLFKTKVGVGLGFGGINENKMAHKAMERAFNTLRDYKKKWEEFEVKNIYAFGTSAIRNADNQHFFVTKVQEEIGITINVISGKEEAAFIYNGVSIGHSFTTPGIIMDIGGGSTEFIVADEKGVVKAQSFEIGVARIFQKFTFSDPLSMLDCEKIEAYLDKEAGDFFDNLSVKELVGASGSFETFYELVKDVAYPENEFVELSIEDMEKSLSLVLKSSQAERDENPRIIPIRKKMAPIAAVKVRWIIRKLNIRTVIISPFALKEGVISSLFN